MSRNKKLFYGSSYDRCLQIVLKLWPRIVDKFPDATLEVCYGWDLFNRAFSDNPERQKWKERINKQMEQKGITHHGRLGKKELQEVRSKCGVWVYPTYFQEINCITALECQSDGLVPVTMNDFALKETVGSGSKVDGDIYDEEVEEKWLSELLKYMGDKKLWEQESDKAIEFAKNYKWDEIAKLWEKYL